MRFISRWRGWSRIKWIWGQRLKYSRINLPLKFRLFTYEARSFVIRIMISPIPSSSSFVIEKMLSIFISFLILSRLLLIKIFINNIFQLWWRILFIWTYTIPMYFGYDILFVFIKFCFANNSTFKTKWKYVSYLITKETATKYSNYLFNIIQT